MIIDVASYGATGTGSDDTAAIEAACAAAHPGDRIFFGPGLFGITRSILPPCSIIGTGRLTSRILALPSMTAPMVNITDKSGMSVSDIGFKGNGVYCSVGAIRFGGASVAVYGTTIERCGFEDIKADYWLEGIASASTYDTIISDNKVTTKISDVLATGTNHVFTLYGTTTGVFSNTKIIRNSIDGTGVSIGVAIYGLHRKFDISHNDISDMGRSTTFVNTLGAMNAYPILIYGLGDTYEIAQNNSAAYGNIIGNLITSPTSAGIYTATASDLLISSNSIRMQSATDTVLPRGGISINGSPNISVLNNLIHDCVTGINFNGPPTGNSFISGNHIKSGAGGAISGIVVGSALAAGFRLSVMGNDINLGSSSSQAFVNTVSGAGNLVIRNNASRAAVHGATDIHTATREIGNNVFFPV